MDPEILIFLQIKNIQKMRVFHLIYDKRLKLKLFVVLSDYAQLDGHKYGPIDNGNKTLPESLKLPKKIPKTAQGSNRK